MVIIKNSIYFKRIICALLLMFLARSGVYAADEPGFFRRLRRTMQEKNLDVVFAGGVFLSLAAYAVYRWRTWRREKMVGKAKQCAHEGKKMYAHQDERERLISYYAQEFSTLFKLSTKEAREYATQYVEGKFTIAYDSQGNPMLPTKQGADYGRWTLKEIRVVWGDGTMSGVKKRFSKKLGMPVSAVRPRDVRWMGNIVSLGPDDALCAICYRTAEELVAEYKGKRRIAILPCGHVFCEEEIKQWEETTCPLDRTPYVEMRSFVLE